jgi:hypothetical protein
LAEGAGAVAGVGRMVKPRIRSLPAALGSRGQELGARLATVDKERWTKPTKDTFADFATDWRTVWLPTRNLKRSTLVD